MDRRPTKTPGQEARLTGLSLTERLGMLADRTPADQIAHVLGMSEADLRTALEGGKSLATVAGEKGIDLDLLKQVKEVERAVTLSWDELNALPQHDVTVDHFQHGRRAGQPAATRGGHVIGRRRPAELARLGLDRQDDGHIAERIDTAARMLEIDALLAAGIERADAFVASTQRWVTGDVRLLCAPGRCDAGARGRRASPRCPRARGCL